MKSNSFQEDYSCQIPALRLLINMGYTYLDQEEVMDLRYSRTCIVGACSLRIMNNKKIFNDECIAWGKVEGITQGK